MKMYLLWALLLMAVVAVVVLLLYIRGRKHSGTPATAADRNGQKPNESREMQAQIDTYIELCHALARQQAEAPWLACFERNAPACQQLLGLLQAPQESLADRVEDALRDVYGLTETGFDVCEILPEPVDEASLRARCAGLTQAEMADSIMLLRHKLHSMPMDYQTLVTALGGALCGVCEALPRGVAALQAALTMLSDTLEQQGVLARFSDDEEINASRELRIRCFTDAADADEIPGLFYRNDKGELVCIGRFGGTRRRDDA